jgi:DNA-binding NtrC family response regulator
MVWFAIDTSEVKAWGNDMTSQTTILLADDEPLERGSLSLLLENEGYCVTAVDDGDVALNMLEQQQFDIILADIRMPRMTGMELLKEIKKRSIDAEVILITAYGEIKDAVEATKLGAYNFVEKDHSMDEELKLTIKRALERIQLRRENEKLKKALNNRNQFYQLVGQSKQMREIYNLIDTIAESTATVLIQGETGTGKDLVAHAIHQRSLRSKERFIKINCAGVPENLLESEMFGHVKGAFTTAVRDKPGMFEEADGGTIFLDDIDTFPLELQAKLLSVLQDRKFERVGSTKTIHVDVRVIAASNQDLRKLMNEGLFRQDLFFRLNVVPIKISPLRERPCDIILLASHFLEKYSEIYNKELEGFTNDAIRMLEGHNWPGNIRELENVIERAVILEKDSFISTQSLMLLQDMDDPDPSPSHNPDNGSLRDEVRDTEREVIIAALERNNWRRQRTANELNINRVTLYNKMKKYGIKEK